MPSFHPNVFFSGPVNSLAARGKKRKISPSTVSKTIPAASLPVITRDFKLPIILVLTV